MVIRFVRLMFAVLFIFTGQTCFAQENKAAIPLKNFSAEPMDQSVERIIGGLQFAPNSMRFTHFSGFLRLRYTGSFAISSGDKEGEYHAFDVENYKKFSQNNKEKKDFICPNRIDHLIIKVTSGALIRVIFLSKGVEEFKDNDPYAVCSSVPFSVN